MLYEKGRNEPAENLGRGGWPWRKINHQNFLPSPTIAPPAHHKGYSRKNGCGGKRLGSIEEKVKNPLRALEDPPRKGLRWFLPTRPAEKPRYLKEELQKPLPRENHIIGLKRLGPQKKIHKRRSRKKGVMAQRKDSIRGERCPKKKWGFKTPKKRLLL